MHGFAYIKSANKHNLSWYFQLEGPLFQPHLATTLKKERFLLLVGIA